jgi:hypothetical protein
MKSIAWFASAFVTLAATSALAMGRLADVSVVDRTAGRSLPLYWHEGRAYVAGTPGHEYTVTVRNRQGGDLLAVASVDGVNVISGDTARSSQEGYVIDGWGRLDIKGWRKSTSETASFYFTSLGDSYAARTERPDNVGVIGVALFERSRPAEPPAMEQDLSRESDSRRERAKSTTTSPAMAAPSPGVPLGTGHGRRETSRIRYVDFIRATREPVETLVIRYDSVANLVAMGVIPAYGRRDPSPFPGHFAPDPH